MGILFFSDHLKSIFLIIFSHTNTLHRYRRLQLLSNSLIRSPPPQCRCASVLLGEVKIEVEALITSFTRRSYALPTLWWDVLMGGLLCTLRFSWKPLLRLRLVRFSWAPREEVRGGFRTHDLIHRIPRIRNRSGKRNNIFQLFRDPKRDSNPGPLASKCSKVVWLTHYTTVLRDDWKLFDC